MKRLRLVAIALISLVIILGFTPTSLLAQGSSPADLTDGEKAPVVFDGRFLFEVGSIEDFSAERRADYAVKILHEELHATPLDQSIPVTVVAQNRLTTIRINDRHLLTLTEGDFMLGTTSAEQAWRWRDVIDLALAQGQQERSPAYQRQAIAISAGIVAGAIALQILFSGLGRWLRRWQTRQSSPVISQSLSQITTTQRILVQLMLLLMPIAVWITVAYIITDRFPVLRQWRYDWLTSTHDGLKSPLVTLGDRGYSLLDIGILVGLVLALWILVRSLTNLLKSQILSTTGSQRGIQEGVINLSQYIVLGIGLIVILQIWGIDVSSLAILASVLGVGIGFGLQNIANNFVSGLVILLERPIQVGDFIKMGDLVGTVERIGARSTEIRTLDQVSIIIPNADFIDGRVVNWSHGHPVSRLHVPFGVAYGSDMLLVQQTALDAAKRHADVLGYPQPQVWFNSFGDSSLNFELLVWINDPRSQFQLRSDLCYLLETNFRRYNIEVPFPQRDLHLRSPDIEQAVRHWMQQQGAVPDGTIQSIPDNGHEMEPSASQPVSPTPFQASDLEDSPLTRSLAELLTRHSTSIKQRNAPTDCDIDELVTQMRGSHGVAIQERRYRFNTYANCFVGSEAVDWLMHHQKATREEAIRLGQTLVDRGIIHHVLDEHPFADGHLFYRFYADEA